MNNIVKFTASRYGIIAASIGIAYTYIAYLVDLKSLAGGISGIGLFVLILILFIAAVNSVKKAQGGYISFKEAFTTFVVAYIINALIVTLFKILLFNVADPKAADEINKVIIQNTINLMERLRVPESQIESTIQNLENNNPFSANSQVRSFFLEIIFFAVIGLIVAAFAKKNEPDFIEIENPDTE